MSDLYPLEQYSPFLFNCGRADPPAEAERSGAGPDQGVAAGTISPGGAPGAAVAAGRWPQDGECRHIGRDDAGDLDWRASGEDIARRYVGDAPALTGAEWRDDGLFRSTGDKQDIMRLRPDEIRAGGESETNDSVFAVTAALKSGPDRGDLFPSGEALGDQRQVAPHGLDTNAEGDAGDASSSGGDDDRMRGGAGDDDFRGCGGVDLPREGDGSDRFILKTDGDDDVVRGFSDRADPLIFASGDERLAGPAIGDASDGALVEYDRAPTDPVGIDAGEPSPADFIFA